MKRLSLVAMAIFFASLVACNQASAGSSFNQQAKLDSLEKDFKQVKEEFEIIKYALDKRGISLEQARAEMEADNKVWDIPDEDSPVFARYNELQRSQGNTHLAEGLPKYVASLCFAYELMNIAPDKISYYPTDYMNQMTARKVRRAVYNAIYHD